MISINMYILEHELRILYGRSLVSSLHAPEGRADITRCSLWQSTMQADENTVYLLDDNVCTVCDETSQDDAFEIPSKRVSAICIGEAPNFMAADKRYDFIELPGGISISDAMNDVQSIFGRYLEWEETLIGILLDGSGIDKMVECSVPIFENTILVHDGDFNVIACTIAPDAKLEGAFEQFYEDLDKTGSFPNNFMDTFLAQKSFLDSLVGSEPNYWHDEMWKVDPSFKIVPSFINVHITDDYLVRITVDPTNNAQYSGDLIKLKILAKYVKLYYTSPYVENAQSLLALDRILGEMLEGTFVDEKELTGQLHLRGWSYDDVLICAKVLISSESPNGHQLKSIAARLESVNAGSCAFPHNDYVAFVQNLTRRGISESEFMEMFDRSLDENNLHAGVSYSFGDIFSIDKMFQQAEIALRYGENSGDKRLRTFDSAILDYLIGNDKARLAVEYLCPKPLLMLLNYDKHHNANMTDTLRLYLDCNCNASKCCELLFIHRSTLTYRIERIEAIMGIDLEDVETRLLYQIMVRMMYIRSGATGPYAKACRIYCIC